MTNPPWSAFAADAIRRLQHSGAAEAAGPEVGTGPDHLDWLRDPAAGRPASPLHALAASRSAMPLPFGEQKEIAMAGGDPFAVARDKRAGRPGCPPRVPLPTDRLLLLLRLCAAARWLSRR